MNVLSVRRGLHGRRNLASHPRGVVLLLETGNAEVIRRLLQRPLIVVHVLIERGLRDAALLGGFGKVAVTVGRGLEVGGGHVGKGFVGPIELFANGVPLSVAEQTKERVDLRVEL